MSLPVNINPINVSVSSSGENTAIAGVSGRHIRVYAIALTLASAGTVTFKDGAGGSTLGAFQGVTQIVLDPIIDNDRYTCSIGNAFIVNLSSGISCTGTIWYTQS